MEIIARTYDTKIGSSGIEKALRSGNSIVVSVVTQDCSNASSDQTFQMFSEKFIKLKELSGKEHKTIIFYKSLLARINPIIGDCLLSAITPVEIEDLYINLAKTGQNKNTGDKLSSKTILEHLRLISAIYDVAIARGLVIMNPVKSIDKPKVIHKKANYFQPSELHEIHDALIDEPLKWKLMTLLLMYTGCRRAEIVGLSWKNVNFPANVININRTILYSSDKGIYESTTKTPESNRSLKLPSEAIELLNMQRELQLERKKALGDRWKNSDYVFTQEDGSPMHPDSITSWLSDFSKRHGLPHINPHAFRHTMASMLIYKGVDIANVSKYLGHSSIRTTLSTYTHIIDEYNASKEKMIIGDIIMEI
ncbi:MAG: site-specific integrase [Oscillospiraceae bacterium]|nr:site-specific integrase [Oscillospiraceae bacterium]